MQKKINIIHYWGGFPIIATSKWLSALTLVKKCAENNWNNWNNWLVLSKQPDDLSLVTPFIDAGCKIIYQPRSKGNFDLKSIYRNYKFMRLINCDILHCYNDHTSPLIAGMLSRTPVKVWSKLSMSSYYEKGVKPQGLKKLMPSTRLTCLLANRILAISDAARKEICDQVGFDNKISIVDVPVQLERFTCLEKSDEIREEFHLLKSDYLITAVGHFIEVKGWDIAVPAFAKVCKSIPNAKLLLVGKKTSDSFYQKIVEKIEFFNLKDKVIFAGNRSDIPEILKASDLFILPSRSEGTPAALIEAMASGLPCIATNAGGMPEVIENGDNGYLFEKGNVDELANKINSIALDPDLKIRFITNAQKDLHKFSIERYVDNVFNHYQDLLRH
ncbi:glycosyltransferase family 4 protein [uncultured Psychromonas sp.]|uniref:glycosyltransferase family 4 protein n=1 Tax=uncultured Psychromonas sp. TaxID=173974 RepID=UPI00260ECF3A|nr:glycosyltransferase family 4 protein [uncultured Psychromonas sp.]